MSFIKKINFTSPYWIIVLIIVSVTWVNFNQVRWNRLDVIDHDIRHYYSYLPAFFYEHDLSLEFIKDQTNWERDGTYYWPNKAPNGNYVIKMSMGMALTYLPFFGLAHVYAKVFDYETSGFSEPYHFAVLFSSLFYFVCGLFYLIKILRHWFSNKTISLVLFLICFGTNVFFYLTFAGGLAHTTGFGFVAAFIYYTIRWHARPTLPLAVLIGLLLGLITLIRPVNTLMGLFFILFSAGSWPGLILQLKIFLSRPLQVMLLLLTAFLIFIPQLLYWKYATGNYFFNSYVGERFYFANPHVVDGLFSFRKGWLLYTPVIALALIGITFLKNSLKQLLLPVIVVVVVYIYVVFSWWCWWYGGSYGQRVMIDIYPLLALPLAAFLLKIETLKIAGKTGMYTFLVLLVLLNLFQTAQAKFNIIHYDSMTRESYFKNFFSLTKMPGDEVYLRKPDYEKAGRGEDEP